MRFRRAIRPEGARDAGGARALEAFEAVADAIERAQRALLSAVPRYRDDGVPLPIAAAAFLDALTEADQALPMFGSAGDRSDAARCSEAITRARSQAERLVLEPDELEFAELNARIGDVLHPLESFVEVERDLRAKVGRRRGR